MSTIIAGRFDATVDADAAIDALRREGFAADEIDSFYVPPAGRSSAPCWARSSASPSTAATARLRCSSPPGSARISAPSSARSKPTP